MTVRGAAFLGIGAMVGAGIFALLGEAGAVAGLGGLALVPARGDRRPLLLGYTVVKLGVRYPSSGGLFAYLLQGFGNGRLVGIAAWLGYFAAIVIVCSMVRRLVRRLRDLALRRRRRGPTGWDNVFTSAIVVAMALIVDRRVAARREAQSLIVFVAARGLRGLHRRDALRHRPRPARVQRLPARLGHRRERRAHVLRLPGLQRDHVRRRRHARPGDASCRRRCTARSASRRSSTSSSRSASSGR